MGKTEGEKATATILHHYLRRVGRETDERVVTISFELHRYHTLQIEGMITTSAVSGILKPYAGVGEAMATWLRVSEFIDARENV